MMKDDAGGRTSKNAGIIWRAKQSQPDVSVVDKSDWLFPLRLQGDGLTNFLLVEGNKTFCLVGQDGGEGLMLGVLADGGHLTAAYPSNKGDCECTGQHGGTTEEEGGSVTSCDVNQPTCRKRRRNDLNNGGTDSSHQESRVCIFCLLVHPQCRWRYNN